MIGYCGTVHPSYSWDNQRPSEVCSEGLVFWGSGQMLSKSMKINPVISANEGEQINLCSFVSDA